VKDATKRKLLRRVDALLLDAAVKTAKGLDIQAMALMLEAENTLVEAMKIGKRNVRIDRTNLISNYLKG